MPFCSSESYIIMAKGCKIHTSNHLATSRNNAGKPIKNEQPFPMPIGNREGLIDYHESALKRLFYSFNDYPIEAIGKTEYHI